MGDVKKAELATLKDLFENNLLAKDAYVDAVFRITSGSKAAPAAAPPTSTVAPVRSAAEAKEEAFLQNPDATTATQAKRTILHHFAPGKETLVSKEPETYDYKKDFDGDVGKALGRVQLFRKNAASSGFGAQYASIGRTRMTIAPTLRRSLAKFALENENNAQVSDRSRGAMNVAKLLLANSEPLERDPNWRSRRGSGWKESHDTCATRKTASLKTSTSSAFPATTTRRARDGRN